jgi:hypothetical protein
MCTNMYSYIYMYIFIFIYFTLHFYFHILYAELFLLVNIIFKCFHNIGLLHWVEYIQTLNPYEMQMISDSFFFSPQEEDREFTCSLPNEVI